LITCLSFLYALGLAPLSTACTTPSVCLMMWCSEVAVAVVVLLVQNSWAQHQQPYHHQMNVVRDNCADICESYYGSDQNIFFQQQQINDHWQSCVRGCSAYGVHEASIGNDPINVLNNCNFSCDDMFYGENIKSCKAGCSFNYEAAVAANSELQHLQAAPRMSRMEEIELPSGPADQGIAQPQQQQPLPPIVQLLNRIMPRINNIMQQTFARQLVEEEEPSSPHIIQHQPQMMEEEREFGAPVVRSFVIPLSRVEGMFGSKQSEDPSPVFSQLFETASNLIQNIPEIPRISMESPWSNFPFLQQNGGVGDQRGELIISRSGPGYSETKRYNLNDGQLIEIDEETRMDNDGLAHVNPMDTDFNESDVEMIDPYFHQQQQVVPAVEAEEHYASEPAYIMDPFTIADNQYVQDPYNMMHLPAFPHQDNTIVDTSPEFDKDLQQSEQLAVESKEMDEVLPAVVENEVAPSFDDEEAVEKAEVEAVAAPQPFREFIVEMNTNDMDIRSLRERLMNFFHLREEQPYVSSVKSDYRDVSCDSDTLPLKDWLACAHLNVGVPRWLTAATIALGIIFSVWLCLVIPSAAPKRKIKNLVIKTQKLSKPSDTVGRELTAAEAKEVEAATANSREPVIAVIKVDLPPTYGVVAPESPVPSYKSDMTPGSPAPSYKSIDTPLRNPEKKLEPVHGGESVA